MTTYADILTRRLREDGPRPLVTFYDRTSGERTELSVATYANWVAKTASLLAEELDVERGGVVRVDLPTHWLGPVFLGACWTLGAAVTWPGSRHQADLVVTGPGGLEAAAGGSEPVLATALHPLGRPFDDPLPVGVHDFGLEVWSQPDAFVPWDPPTADDVAVVTDDGRSSQAELWTAAAAGSLLTSGGRLLTETNPASPSGLVSFTEPLAMSGSVVLLAPGHAGEPEPMDQAWVEDLCATEQVTHRHHPARS